MRASAWICSLWVGLIVAGLSGRVAAASVRALTVEGNAIEGAWLGTDAGQLKLSVQGKETRLDPAQLMGLHWIATTSQPATPASAPADQVTVYLADGSRFSALITGATGSSGESISLQTALVPALDLPLTRLAAVRFSPEDQTVAVKAFSEALADRHATEDTLIVAQDGKVNTLRGVLESLNADGGKFKWRGRSVSVDRSRLFGVVLATGAGAPAAPPARCILVDDSIWAGQLAEGNAEAIRFELAAGPTITIPVDQLSDIRFRNDHLVFLSDLEPSGYEIAPWGTTRWPYRKDRSVANRPLQVGGQVFDRGIGMHSAAVLTYTLNEPFRQFAATVGINDAIGSRGNVVFRVLADGREVFNSGPVTGRDAPRPVLAELNGAKTLQLCVELGEDLDIGDHADWGNARLIR